jgi:hypothetical protein
MSKLGWLSAALLGCAVLYNSQSHQQPVPVTSPASAYAAPQQAPATTVPDEVEQQDDSANAQPEVTQLPSGDEQKQSEDEQPSELSNDNHYTNSDGDSVHSPAYSNTVPAGATAQCSDGTYSFSQHRQGTCSHHGGVSEWLR